LLSTRNFQVAVRFPLPVICKQPWTSC